MPIFQLKCSNNDAYRVNPVFGYVEPGAGAPIEITRLAGDAKVSGSFLTTLGIR